MALSHRPGTVRDGLIYYHDTGNKASFRGEPTINLYQNPFLQSPVTTNGYTSVTNYNGYTEVASDGPWYGAYEIIPVVQGRVYTYSFWYKHINGATRAGGHTDFGANIRIDGGAWQGGNIIDIPNDGEYHFIEIRFTAGDTKNTPVYLQPGRGQSPRTTGHILTGKGYGIQFEEKDHASSFVIGERTSTNSLLDMVGGTQLDVSSTSFDSEGMFFDGTDDGILIPTITLGNGGFAVEAIIRPYDGGTYSMLSNSSGGPVTNAFGNHQGKMHYRNYDGAWQLHYGNTELEPQQLYHLTWVNFAGNTPQEGTMKMYVNGVLDSEEFPSYTTNGGPVDRIGGNWFTSFNGEIPLLKIYRKSLSEAEIAQNFNLIKDRFAL